jgi:hypothetical protein
MLPHVLPVLLALALAAVTRGQERTTQAQTWAVKLGYPADQRILILHADDVGMCYEANLAAQRDLAAGDIQSASAMVPCPWFNELATWVNENPGHCVGLHLALTSEWRWYRWGPVAPAAEVPGLIDPDGYLWRDVPHVLAKATPAEVELEIRAQVQRALKLGVKPSHVDTHMGTLYARPEFTEAYLRVAQEHDIPAMAIEPTSDVVRQLTGRGTPLSPRLLKILRAYRGPKLDMLHAAPNGGTYEDKVAKFCALVRSLKPGITEIYFHPSVETEGLKKITNSWQQRVWEARMFSDPKVKQCLREAGVRFTSWQEMYRRFKERGLDAAASAPQGKR